MTKIEFFEILRTSLEGEIPTSEIDDNIRYYEEYINLQLKEKSYDDIFSELGNPRLIAKTLIETYKISRGPLYNENGYNTTNSSDNNDFTSKYYYNKSEHYNTQNSYRTYKNDYEGSKKHFMRSRVNTWYHKILVYLIGILIFIVILYLGSIALRLFITVGIPILFIFFIYKTITRR